MDAATGPCGFLRAPSPRPWGTPILSPCQGTEGSCLPLTSFTNFPRFGCRAPGRGVQPRTSAKGRLKVPPSP